MDDEFLVNIVHVLPTKNDFFINLCVDILDVYARLNPVRNFRKCLYECKLGFEIHSIYNDHSGDLVLLLDWE